jgi:hypothetical protein
MSLISWGGRRAASGQCDDCEAFIHRPHEVTIDRDSAICQSQSRFLDGERPHRPVVLVAIEHVTRSSRLPSGPALI